VAGEALGKADAALIRAQTGFAIGGVAPVGHLNPIRAFFDPRLSDFDEIYAAAGTPRHIFPIPPSALSEISGAELSDFTTQ
jgi:prolyl-tRNA editing enzyme YbaK/EbsC (Cys-tRNA(Pro) deacylase)